VKINMVSGIVAACLVSIVVSGCCSVCPCKCARQSGPVALFDGNGLDGWVPVLTDPKATLGDVWKVQDGMIVCDGEPMGYLQSADKYQDFDIELEYCFPAGQSNVNSGIFIQVNGEPKALLPSAIECQLKPGSAGDLMGFHGMKLQGPAERMAVTPGNPKTGKLTKITRQTGNELNMGEWNKVRVLVEGKTVTAWFNGKQVNQADGLESVKGHIGLQSEGGTIHFRNIRITRL